MTQQTQEQKSRERITEEDEIYLRFLAKFPAADAMAMCYLKHKGANNFGADTTKLTTPGGVEHRFKKLIRLRVATKYRSLAGVTHYGLTKLGQEYLIGKQLDFGTWKGIAELSEARLEHYRAIALVAAQLMSPDPIWMKKLGIATVPIDYIVSENEMREAFTPIDILLRDKRKNGESAETFAKYRKAKINQCAADISTGKLPIEDMVEEYPQLLTIGSASKDLKAIHQPDLALRLDTYKRTSASPKGKNWLIEVERSQKSQTEYERILKTLKEEFSSSFVYERAVYFVGTQAIEKLLIRADEAAGTNLIGKRLVIIPIQDLNGLRRSTARRVTVPKERETTIGGRV